MHFDGRRLTTSFSLNLKKNILHELMRLSENFKTEDEAFCSEISMTEAYFYPKCP
jgi:hypothetical protein